MTKKNFIALANHIKDIKRRYENGAVTADPFSLMQCCELADFCESQNPRFDRARWLGYIAGTNGPNGRKIN